jgi:hypothetical protein
VSDREFTVELCNRAIAAHDELLKVQCEVARLDFQKRCAELTVKSLNQQIGLIKYRDSIVEEVA